MGMQCFTRIVIISALYGYIIAGARCHMQDNAPRGSAVGCCIRCPVNRKCRTMQVKICVFVLHFSEVHFIDRKRRVQSWFKHENMFMKLLIAVVFLFWTVIRRLNVRALCILCCIKQCAENFVKRTWRMRELQIAMENCLEVYRVFFLFSFLLKKESE